MKNRVVFLALVIGLTVFYTLLGAETTIQIGSGDFPTHYPLNDYYTYTRSQQLYLASEIGTQGIITKLRWYRSDTGSDPAAIGTTEIWLRPYHYNEFLTPDWEDPGTLVASLSNIDLGSGAEWFEVNIMDYEYSGSNLMVSVRTQDAPYTSPHAYWYSTNYYPLHFSKESHDDYYNPPDYMVYGNVRPNIQLVFEPFTPTAVPNPATLLYPANGANNQLTDITMSWNSGGGMPSGYTLFLGTDNPPANIVNGVDLGNSYLYTPSAPLSYGQTYYWQIVPYNAIGSAEYCPVWSFSTYTPVSTFPHSYGFEEEQFPLNGWKHNIVSGASGFLRVIYSSQPTTNPHTGSWFGKYSCRTLPSNSSAKLSSPPIQRTDSGYNYSVSFWMFRDSGYASNADRVNVWVGRQDTQDATLLGTIHRNKSMTPVETGSNTWYQYSFALPEGVTDFITFEAISAYGYNISLDDIVFSRTPVGGSPPGFAGSPTPANYGFDVPPDIELSWAPVDNATTYRVTFMNTSNMVTGVVDTATPAITHSANGYNETVKWTVDPGNQWGYASSQGSPPVWQYTTLPPNVPGAYPAPGTTDWNPGNRLLDWESLPGADAYVVKMGTSPGATDIVSSVTVTDTKYVNPLDYPQSSNLWWQANPVRNQQEFDSLWKPLTTGPAVQPGYPVVVEENFDTLSPPGIPPGWRAMSYSNVCGAGVYTAPGSPVSPPNQLFFNSGGDPIANQNMYGPVIPPALRPWKAIVSFHSANDVSAIPCTVQVSCVSDQSSNPLVYSQQSVVIPPTMAQQSAVLDIPAGVPTHVKIAPAIGSPPVYMDNVYIEGKPADPPMNFQIVKDGNQLKLRWGALTSDLFGYKVYRSTSPYGPWELIGNCIDPTGTQPMMEYNLGSPGTETKYFYYVTAELVSPYSDIPPD